MINNNLRLKIANWKNKDICVKKCIMKKTTVTLFHWKIANIQFTVPLNKF